MFLAVLKLKPLKVVVGVVLLGSVPESTELFLQGQINQENHSHSSSNLITDFELLKQLITAIKTDVGNKLTLYIMFLEVVIFKPYYNLGNTNDDKKIGFNPPLLSRYL